MSFRMPFFRPAIDLRHAATRPANPNDAPAIARIVRESPNRLLFEPPHIATLLAGAPALVLMSGDRTVGFAVADWPDMQSVWLRGVGFAEGVPPRDAVPLLFPDLHHMLIERGVGHVLYAGDTRSDVWLAPLLEQHGYIHLTDVVVYEKHGTHAPSTGNQQIRVRRAETVDLAALVAIDRASFSPKWHKDGTVLGPAVAGEVPLFLVAEDARQVIGYAFATSHFNGRLVHLVRIAVDPAWRGQAVGVRLLAEVMAFARSVGASTITLNTQVDNYAAQRLYEWFGFQRTGERQPVLRCTLTGTANPPA